MRESDCTPILAAGGVSPVRTTASGSPALSIHCPESALAVVRTREADGAEQGMLVRQSGDFSE